MTSREVGSAAVIRGSAGSPHRPTPRPAGPHYPLVGPCATLRLSAGETDLESLLPDRWAASHPEHVLQHRLDESRRRAARKKATARATSGSEEGVRTDTSAGVAR